MTQEQRAQIAAQFACALINRRDFKFDTKKQLVDNAIAYADMLNRRLGEIPQDAQVRSEEGMRKRPRIDWDEINRIANQS